MYNWTSRRRSPQEEPEQVSEDLMVKCSLNLMQVVNLQIQEFQLQSEPLKKKKTTYIQNMRTE